MSVTKHAGEMVGQAEANVNAQVGDVPLAGHFVLWNVESILIEDQVLRNGLKQHGLTGLAPYPIRPKTAMKRAIAEFLATSQLVRRTADTKEYSVYVIKTEFEVPGRDKLPDLDWTTDLKMAWYKDEGNDPDRALGFSDEARGNYYRPIVAKYLTSYVAGDISELLRRGILMHQGVSLRSGGGVYFYPADRPGATTQAEFLSHLKAFMAWLAKRSRSSGVFLSAIAIPATSDGISDLSRHVNHALKAELKKVADDIRGMEERFASTTVSVETITKYYNRVEQMQQKALLYVDLVRLQADEVSEMVRDLGQRCQDLIEKAAPDPFAEV